MTDPTTRPEVDDPRVLALAKARQQLAYENPFNAVCPPWDGLSEQEQHLSLLDARSYLHAALKAGLAAPAVPAGQAPAADRAALREQIAETMARADGWEWAAANFSSLSTPAADRYRRCADAVLAVLPAAGDRAAVLRELIAKAEEWDGHITVQELRRMAAEPAAVTATPGQATDEAPPVCQGFVWIGQPFTTCDRCARPAWEHAGEEVPVEGAGPFDNRRTVRPWESGQADRIRAKWAPEQPAAGAQPEPGHTGGVAEDCSACQAEGLHKLGYPWTCPGPEQPAGAQQPKEA